MVSRVRRISLVFQNSRSSNGARLWVERAAKTRSVRQTLPAAQFTTRRKDLPAKISGHSSYTTSTNRPTSNPWKSNTDNRPQEGPASGRTGRNEIRREPGSPTDRPPTSPDLLKTVTAATWKVNHSGCESRFCACLRITRMPSGSGYSAASGRQDRSETEIRSRPGTNPVTSRLRPGTGSAAYREARRRRQLLHPAWDGLF
jgi:hypothetical protein